VGPPPDDAELLETFVTRELARRENIIKPQETDNEIKEENEHG
jgi:hypothetical protein